MKPASFFTMSGLKPPGPPSRDEIKAALRRDKSLDYLAGRAIKTVFRDLTKVETRSYDRDAGTGTFERIVADLRNTKSKL